jgi:ATP-dependent Clp protease ATP-binding subunit ClpC
MTEEHEMAAHMWSDPTVRLLAEKRCTTKVIDVLLQVRQEAADRTRLLNHPFTESLTLLTLLRSEINVAQAALKEIKVDLRVVEERLDKLLDRCDRVVFNSQEQVDDDHAHTYQEAWGTVLDLVERSKQEAAVMKHDYVGTEHLLLAIIRRANAFLSTILADLGVTYEAAQNAIRKLLYS